ncbi:MAG: DNRLRE domain-containing protein [Fibrobacterales bacterium]
MRYLNVLITLSLLFLINACSIISEEQSSGSISGITITGSNKTTATLKVANTIDSPRLAKQGVMLYLFAKGNEQKPVDSTQSNVNGIFTFLNIEFGEYVLMADFSETLGAIKRNINLNKDTKVVDGLEIAMKQYKSKLLKFDNKSVSAIKYFHKEIKKSNDQFYLPVLDGEIQNITVTKMIGGTLEVSQYVLVVIEREGVVVLIPIDEYISSSMLVSSSEMIGGSSFSLSSNDFEVSYAILSSIEQLSSSSSLNSQKISSSSIDNSHSSVPVWLSSDFQLSSNSQLSSDYQSSSSTTDISAQLLTYWKFDDSFIDEEGVADGYDINNNVTFISGVSGSAAKLGTNNQSIRFNSAPEVLHLQEFSIVGWINLQSLKEYQMVFGNYKVLPGVSEGMGIQIRSSQQLEFSYGKGSSWNSIWSNETIPLDTWVHIGVTKDHDVMSLYINGINVKTQAALEPIIHSSPGHFGKGIDSLEANDYSFDGSIDEFKVYNYSLQSEDVLIEYNRLKPQIPIEIVIQPGPTEGKDSRIVYNGSEADNIYTNRNSGGFKWLNVGGYDPHNRQRTLIAFPLATAPVVMVSNARMVLYRDTTYTKHFDIDFQIDMHQMLRDWNEGTCDIVNGGENSICDGATGVEAMFGSPWNAEAVALDGTDATASFTSVSIPVEDLWSIDTVSFDVTTLVNEWISGTSNNFGVLLKNPYDIGNSDNYPSFPAFASSEHPEAFKRPKLVIRY